MIFIVPQEERQGYELITNSQTGERLAIQRSTGEALSWDYMPVVYGSIVYTPEQQEAYEKRKKRKDRKDRLARLGKFFFLDTQNGFKSIKPATAARVVYLGTFLKYETNDLYRTRNAQMKKEDLPKILGVSETTAFRFLKEVSPQYVQVDDDGCLHLNDRTFWLGEMDERHTAIFYRKVYVDKVRELYKGTPTTKHKELGYIFSLLPYINMEYNVLCRNIFEKDISEIEPLTLREFCQEIGHSFDSVQRLLNTYANIKVLVNGLEEPFCAFVYDGANIGDAQIYVNPHVLYNGSDPEQVELLETFWHKKAVKSRQK